MRIKLVEWLLLRMQIIIVRVHNIKLISVSENVDVLFF